MNSTHPGRVRKTDLAVRSHRRGARLRPPCPAGAAHLGKYCIRFKVSAAEREDAWDLCRLAHHYGGVEVCDCCFVFSNEEQRSAASEALRLCFGPEYFEEVDMAAGSGEARLLIVARDEELREKCCRFLAERGFLISEADNGVECMEILRGWRPQAVVLKDDIVWGGSDGVLERMRQDADLATIPVVLIADASLRGSEAGRLASSGIVRVWEPVGLEGLLHAVQSALLAGTPAR